MVFFHKNYPEILGQGRFIGALGWLGHLSGKQFLLVGSKIAKYALH